MKVFIAVGAALVAASCATAPPPTDVVPVEIVQGKIVHLWSVSAARTLEGARVAGLASRRLTPNGPVNEHLHAEAMDSEGRVLMLTPVAWNSIISLRSKKSASFQTEFASTGAGSISHIRLSVIAGAVHREGQ
jgi:hypothetical protein